MPTSTRASVEPLIIQYGTDHTLAPLAVRERMALSADATAELLQALVADPSIGEAAILSTCNRTEVYAAVRDPESGIDHVRQALTSLLGDMPAADVQALLFLRRGVDAVRHLAAVAAGLRSMVVAEGQILGQVKDALDCAQRLGTAGAHLGGVFRAAIACGKRVRSETALGRADISASSVLLDLLSSEIDDWSAQRALLIGAGRISQVTADRLRALGPHSITVASRTLAAATHLAETIGGAAAPLESLPDLVADATLIVSATRSPGLMLTPDLLQGRPAQPLLVVDLAMPRDVDPAVAAMPGVRLLDIDDLRDIQDRRGFGDALEQASAIVDQAAVDWQIWCRTREAVPLIADLRAHVDRQKEAELRRTLAHLDHLALEEQAEVREMAHRLVNKMFHHLASRMKLAAADPELGATYLEAAKFLFQAEERAAHADQPAPAGVHASTPGDPVY